MALVACVIGVSVWSIERWHGLFKSKGSVLPEDGKNQSARYPKDAIEFVEDYIRAHPCFYLDELQEAVEEQFGSTLNNSTPTLCRLLKFDLKSTRKILTKRTRESMLAEVEEFYRKLRPFYSGPDQLVFIDETSKDGRDALRKYAWSRRGTSAIVAGGGGGGVCRF
ncbi:Transposase [Phytophthora megakarya]|uniref:Transposase n=1 Tax=Phytophthora megakarya TaxID=4795 RepID=A0A225VNL3_9STRA|nr:Transposase [Phytophthora megakarya]